MSIRGSVTVRGSVTDMDICPYPGGGYPSDSRTGRTAQVMTLRPALPLCVPLFGIDNMHIYGLGRTELVRICQLSISTTCQSEQRRTLDVVWLIK